MDTTNTPSWSPLPGPQLAPPASAGHDPSGKKDYLEPALSLCGSVPAITGGSDIFGDMDA